MFAVIHIRDFYLQAALRHAPDWRREAVALVDSDLSKAVILQSTPSAQTDGVEHGMTASQALARCPRLKIMARAPEQEALATEILLQTAYGFSPNIEATRPGVCTLELKGLGLASAKEMQGWGGKIIETLESLSLGANVGIGPTPDLALLASVELGVPSERANRKTFNIQPVLRSSIAEGGHSTPNAEGTAPEAPRTLNVTELYQAEFPEVAAVQKHIVRTGGKATFASEEFVAGLALEALAPPEAIADILLRWGIRTVGEFLALGKAEVAERLGPEALELFARVSPQTIRPLRLVSPPEQFSEQVEFENEVETAEPVLLWLDRFTEQLSRRLDAIYLAVAQMRLRLGLASGAKYERLFKIPSPTGDRKVLLRMLQTHLETLRTDSPIVSLQLDATPAKPELHQFGLFQNTLRNPNQFAETLTRLGALVGNENAGTPVLESTHRPDAFRVQPPNFEFVPAQDSQPPKPAEGLEFRRFRPPLPAAFEFQENKPARIRSELFNGAIAGLRGPFLSSGNWWDASRWAREEWDAELAGGALLRLFRSSDGCFVEGVYD